MPGANNSQLEHCQAYNLTSYYLMMWTSLLSTGCQDCSVLMLSSASLHLAAELSFIRLCMSHPTPIARLHLAAEHPWIACRFIFCPALGLFFPNPHQTSSPLAELMPLHMLSNWPLVLGLGESDLSVDFVQKVYRGLGFENPGA